jgi:hypothetical protein
MRRWSGCWPRRRIWCSVRMKRRHQRWRIWPLRYPCELTAELVSITGAHNQTRMLLTGIARPEIHPHHATLTRIHRYTRLKRIELEILRVRSLKRDRCCMKLCHATIGEVNRKPTARSELQGSEIKLRRTESEGGKNPCQSQRHSSRKPARRWLVLAESFKLRSAQIRSEFNLSHVMRSYQVFREPELRAR